MCVLRIPILAALLSLFAWTDPAVAERQCDKSLYTLDCFEPYGTRLLPRHKEKLDRIADRVAESWAGKNEYYPFDHVTVIGHSAFFKKSDPAEKKALERAQNTVDYLRQAFAERDVSGVKIVVAGVGVQEPITTNDTKQGRNINRRTEVFLRSKRGFRSRLDQLKDYAGIAFKNRRITKISGQSCHSDYHAEKICADEVQLATDAELVGAVCLPWSIRCVIGMGRKQ